MEQRERERDDDAFSCVLLLFIADVGQHASFVSTCDVENRVVSTEGRVLPALTLPIDHDLHDLCPQRDAGGVQGQGRGGAIACLVILALKNEERGKMSVLLDDLCVCDHARTHCVPHIDVALASPVVALREGLPVGEHIASVAVGALPKAVIVHPGRPVEHVAGAHLSVCC